MVNVAVEAPPPALSRGRQLAVLGVCCLSVLLVISALASVNVALPDIGTQLRASQTDLQWVVDAYTVVLAALLLPAGALGDRFGRKQVLLGGLFLFGCSSVIAAEAASAGVLIGARVLMGIGAALLFPSSLSLITTAFPPEQRQRAIGAWAGTAAAGGVIGFLATGSLLHYFWWGSLFWFNAIGSLLCLLATAAVVPTSGRERDARLDPGGALLAVIAVGTTVYAIIDGPTRGWASPLTIAGLLNGTVAGAVFLAYEAHTSNPMLDPRIFRTRSVAAGSALITMQYFGAFGYFFVVTQYLQYVRDYTPLGSGIAVAPVGVLVIFGAALAVPLSRTVGLRVLGASGLLLMASSCVLLALCGTHTAYWPLPLLAMVLFGAGLGVSTAQGTTAITQGLPQHKQGIASALNDTTREVGAAIGIAVCGSLLNTGYRSALHHDMSIGTLTRADGAAAIPGFSAAQHAANVGGSPVLLSHAEHAFVHGMTLAMLTTTAVLILSALAVALLAPARTLERSPPRAATSNLAPRASITRQSTPWSENQTDRRIRTDDFTQRRSLPRSSPWTRMICSRRSSGCARSSGGGGRPRASDRRHTAGPTCGCTASGCLQCWAGSSASLLGSFRLHTGERRSAPTARSGH